MNARDVCLRFYWKAESLIAPGLKYSQAIYEGVLREYSVTGGFWLDLGCGHRLLPEWRRGEEPELARRARLLVGLDYSHESLKKHTVIRHRVRGDISKLPFGDNSFDLVTSNMVFEHLKEPGPQLAEVFRVLRPGGLLVFHTPNAQSYGTAMARLVPECVKRKLTYLLEGRKAEDVFPTFYKMNTPRAIREVAASVGFQVKRIRLIVSSAQFIMVPPVALVELVLIRLLMTNLFKPFRPNIIAVLGKPHPGV